MDTNNNYTINTFTSHHDNAFIQYAYRHILKRDVDEEGRIQYLSLLRSGKKTKVQILCLLRYSPEGQKHHSIILGLKKHYIFSKLFKVPLLGSILRFFSILLRFPQFLKKMDQIEANNGRLLYALDQIDTNFKWTTTSIETLSEIIDTKASSEDIKILHRLLVQKMNRKNCV